MIRDLGYDDYAFIDAELISYFNKPLIKLCIHIADLQNSVNTQQDIFYKNIANGLNIVGPTSVINKIKKEVSKWSDHAIKNLIIFEESDDRPTLHLNEYNKDLFYAGIYLAGSRLNEWEGLGMRYTHHKLYKSDIILL